MDGSANGNDTSLNNTLTQFIKTYKNALTPDQCQTLIAHFESKESHWSPIILNDGSTDVKLDIKRVKQVRLSPEKESDKEADGILFDSIGTILQQYLESVNGHYPNAVRDSGYNLMKYEPNTDFCDWHTDATSGAIGNRVAAVVWYLNTISEGGATEFEWGKKIQPKAGTAIIYPANWLYVHRAVAPVSSPKYVATTWMIY